MNLQKTGQVACHKQIKDVAMAATGQWYEALMGASNDIYTEWKRQNPDCTPKQLEKMFINRFWPRCIDFARATLTIMLSHPEVSDEMKMTIMDVLEKDQYLRRKLPPQVQPMHVLH